MTQAQATRTSSIALTADALDPTHAQATRISSVALTAETLDATTLRAALELRLPAIRVLDAAAPCDTGCAAVHARRGPDSHVELTVRLADRRVFTRTLSADPDEPERATATSLAHLLTAIEDGSATPSPPPTPPPLAIPDTSPITATPPPADITPTTASPPRVTPRTATTTPPPAPPLELGPTLALTTVHGLGPPRALAGAAGLGLALSLELRTPRGLLTAFGLRALQARDGELRLQRVRLALAIGYSLRRGRFELRTLAAATVEPWWVAQRTATVQRDSGPPLLGGALALAPGLTARVGPRLRVHAGLRLEAAASTIVGERATVQASDPTGTPRFRLGGLELSALVEIGLRWDVSRPRPALKPP